MLTNQVIARDRRFKAAISGAGQGNALSGYGTDQYVIGVRGGAGQAVGEPRSPGSGSPIRSSTPDRIVTPTLFLCGEDDWNVPLLNSEQMYQALKSLGRETRAGRSIPGSPTTSGGPASCMDRMKRYLEWYGKYLGGDTRSAAPSAGGTGVALPMLAAHAG